MAVADAKAYFLTLEKQRNELKADLDDFKKALEDGYITEDQLQGVYQDFDIVDTNYQRIAYFMWLLGLPRRHKNMTREDKELLEKFKFVKSDEESIALENSDVMKYCRAEMKKLGWKKKQE